MAVINIFSVWQALMSEVNVQQGGQIRPVSDFTYWYNKISNELFRERVAAAELSQQLDDDLAPFKKSINIIPTPQLGQPFDLVRYPDDYAGFANMKIIRQKDTDNCACDCQLPVYKDTGKCLELQDADYAAMEAKYLGMNLAEVTIQKIDTQRWGSCLDHISKGPSFKSPKTTQYKDGFKIAPKAISSVVLDYYTTPVEAVFGYTIGAGDIVVYDSTTSTQLQWSSTLTGEFLARLRKIYGVHVSDLAMYQMGDNDKKQVA